MDFLARTVPVHFGPSHGIVFLSVYRRCHSTERAVAGQYFFHNGNYLCAAIVPIACKFIISIILLFIPELGIHPLFSQNGNLQIVSVYISFAEIVH